jgi:uncharacterized membrane-anchored protein
LIKSRSQFFKKSFYEPGSLIYLCKIKIKPNENRTESIVAQSGDLAGDEKETPRMAAKIGVLPHLKTNLSSV